MIIVSIQSDINLITIYRVDKTTNILAKVMIILVISHSNALL